eukprot:scaffold1578_cov340-Prasinococcus_capsulatus_cf.AAC.4
MAELVAADGDVGAAADDERDRSVAQELRRRGGGDAATMGLAEACYANDFGCATAVARSLPLRAGRPLVRARLTRGGLTARTPARGGRCSLRQLGLREARAEAARWVYGEEYLVPQQPLSSLVAHLARGLRTLLGWEARSVRLLLPAAAASGGDGGADARGGDEEGQEEEEEEAAAAVVEVVSADGRVVRAEYVVVAVPLTTLQRGFLSFSPPLSGAKRAALRRVRVGNALKLIVSFTARFWAPSFFDAVCVGTLFPELWVTERAAAPSAECSADTRAPAHGGVASMTFFVAGEAASASASCCAASCGAVCAL